MRGGDGVCSGIIAAAPLFALATAGEDAGGFANVFAEVLTGVAGLAEGSSRNVTGVFALV